jgi:hypothetical protein
MIFGEIELKVYANQDLFALLVSSCCDKSETSFITLLSRLMTVTDLLQVVTTRLNTGCS